MTDFLSHYLVVPTSGQFDFENVTNFSLCYLYDHLNFMALFIYENKKMKK